MEYYDGVYVFGKVDKAFYPTSGERSRIQDTIELAPDIYAKVIDERVSLCHTSRKQTHVCFWEGDCEVVLDVDGQRITINDHDEKKGNKSYFTVNGVKYHTQGHLFQLDDDEVTRLRYTVYRGEEEVRRRKDFCATGRIHREKKTCPCNDLVDVDSDVCKRCEIVVTPFVDSYTKEDVTETHYVNEVFTVKLYDNPSTGYSTKLEPSDGLMILGKDSSLACTNPGCGSYATYRLKGITRGPKTLLIHTGQMWDPKTITTEAMHFDIIDSSSYTKENTVETHRLGGVFSVVIDGNYVQLEPSDGLMITGSSMQSFCTGTVCDGRITYHFKGVTRGPKTLLIRRDRQQERMHFEIV